MKRHLFVSGFAKAVIKLYAMRLAGMLCSIHLSENHPWNYNALENEENEMNKQ